MARKSLLLVDADPRSLRVLEVSLRKAGYNLATCGDVQTALETIEYSPPELIVCDTRLPGPSGFELVETLRKNPDWASIPMIFLSSDTSVESKVRGLQLGVEDYLTKPIYIKEIVARINLTLARVERESVARRSSISKTRFSGSLSDMGLVDLLQTIDISRKSGVLELRSGPRSGLVTFRDGQVFDAELGSFFAERAIYRLLLWSEGEFEIDFRPVRVEQRVQIPTQGLLMEGMRRLDEWGRLCEQIPPIASVLEVQADELSARLAELPDEINGILKLFDGHRSIQDVVDAVDADDLATLGAISKLYFEGVVQPTGRIRTLRPGEVAPAGADGDANEVVPITTPPGDDTARTEERALSDEGNLTVPGRPSLVPAAGNPPSMVPAPPTPSGGNAVVPAIPPALLPGQNGTGTISATGSGGTEDDFPAGEALEVPPSVKPASPSPGGAPSRSPSKTLMGPGFDEAVALARQAASDPAVGLALSEKPGSRDTGTETSGAGPSGSPSAAGNEDEDVMARKKRKNRGGSERQDERETARRVETAPAPEPPRRDEAAEERDDSSNVIQFPAKRSATPTPDEDDDGDAIAASGRDDDTAARRREEEKPASPPASKDTKPLPGELPRVRVHEDGLPKEIAAAPPDARDRRDEKRKKKNPTTSSGEIRALGTGDHAVAAEEFFSSRNLPVPVNVDDFSDIKGTPMPPQSRVGMYATIGIFVVFAIGIGSYWYYNNVHLPQPVALGGHRSTPSIPVLPPATPSGGGEVEPEVGAVEPEIGAVEPEIGAVEPEVGAVEPEAFAVEPEIGAVEPEAFAVEPEVGAVEPEVGAVEPEVAPPAGEYDTVLAEADAARRRPSTAIPLYEQAIALNPNGTAALSQLSYLLINRGRGDDTRRAAEYAERATTLDSTDSLAWLVLAVARETLGDRAGARTAYRACVEQGTPGRWQNECRPHAR